MQLLDIFLAHFVFELHFYETRNMFLKFYDIIATHYMKQSCYITFNNPALYFQPKSHHNFSYFGQDFSFPKYIFNLVVKKTLHRLGYPGKYTRFKPTYVAMSINKIISLEQHEY